MASKTKLSKSILEMKFMKRTKEKVEKELEIEETQKLYKQNLNKKMLGAGESKFYIEPSYFLCEGLREGRLSFRGMNEELEKYLEKTNYWGVPEEPSKQEVEVEDEEMAARFQGYKKFNKLNNMQGQKNKYNHIKKGNKGFHSQHIKKDNRNGPPNKKTKFMKPDED